MRADDTGWADTWPEQAEQRPSVLAFMAGSSGLNHWQPDGPDTDGRHADVLYADHWPESVYPECVSAGSIPVLMSLAESLATMLGQRDDETAEHTERVVLLTGLMAERLGLDEQRRDALIWGARLHDIGKLAVPPEILHKRGTLDSDEWRAMRGHVEAGQAIAESLDCLPRATLCLLAQHHERWDGGGYPAGLAGDDICLEARIFAYCDVYDALSHARSYKLAWSHAEALEEIGLHVGTQFDPGLLGIFLEVAAGLPESVQQV